MSGPKRRAVAGRAVINHEGAKTRSGGVSTPNHFPHRDTGTPRFKLVLPELSDLPVQNPGESGADNIRVGQAGRGRDSHPFAKPNRARSSRAPTKKCPASLVGAPL